MRAPIGPNLAWFMCLVFQYADSFLLSVLNLDDFCFGLNIEEITLFSTHLFLLSLLSQRLQCNIRFILYIITSRFHAFVYCVSAAERPFDSFLGGGLSMD